MWPMAASRACSWFGAAGAALGLTGCVTPLVEHHIPVVAATALLNLETAERCDYVGVGYAVEPDAVITLKNFAGAQGGTLVLGLDQELADAAERDAATGTYAAEVDRVSGKIVRCSEAVQADLLGRAQLLDTR